MAAYESGDHEKAAREIERLAPDKGLRQVDSYRYQEQRRIFLDRALSAGFHDYPEG